MKQKKNARIRHISGNPFHQVAYESWWSRNQGKQAATGRWLSMAGKSRDVTEGSTRPPPFSPASRVAGNATPWPTSRINCGRAQQFPLAVDSIIVRYVAEAMRERWQECVRDSQG
jgi:hypothetical protein